MPGHKDIIELLEKITAEHDAQKLIPLVEQLSKAVIEETKRLNAKIADTNPRYTG